MLTLSVKTSRDHPLPLVGQVKPDGTLVGSCILNWNRGGAGPTK